MPTKAEIEAELVTLKAKHDLFRKAVVESALEAQEAQGWCNEVQDYLRDLGLGDLLPSQVRRVTLTYEVNGEDHGLEDDQDFIEHINGQLWGVDLIESKVEEVSAA